MATDVEATIRRSMKAVQATYDALRSLRTSRSIPRTLLTAESTLDRMLNNLSSLATSSEALASSRAFDALSVTMPVGISLSDALVLDMEATAGRLRFMTPPDSSMIVGDLDDQESRNIAEMVECYDRSVSSVLVQHNVSTLDTLTTQNREILEEVNAIRIRMKEQRDSAAADLRGQVYKQLIPLTSATYKSKDLRPECLAETRVALLKDLSAWASDGASELTVLWLNGMAGTGKSAIAKSFADNMENAGLLGATFFVDRQVAEQRDPHRIVQTLAYDLAERDHIRLHALWSSLREKPAIKDMPLEDQVKALIKKPMGADSSKSLLIIIDGLDECTPSDGARLLSALATSLACFPTKLFVASRRDRDIIEGFDSISPTEMRLQDRPEEEVQKDVRSYWENGLDAVCRKRRLPDWRSLVSVKQLVDLTGYLFIYATTILKIIQNTKGSPIKKLQELLEISSSGSGSAIAFVGSHKHSPLEDVYRYVLAQAIVDDDGYASSEYAAQLHDILEVVIFAREPVSASAIAELLDVDKTEIDGFVVTLLSVLVVPDATDELGVIRPFHQSFPDFVLQQAEHVDIGLTIDVKVAGAHVTKHCLAVLIKKLRFDICELRDPSLFNGEVPDIQTRISRHISAALRYSCRFWFVHWLEHIRAAGPHSQVPSGLDEFCNTHLLHWIESLSFTGMLSDVRWVMFDLLAAMKSQNHLRGLHAGSLLSDAHYLMRDYHIPIGLSALQVYHSGLVSMPECGLRTLALDMVVGRLVSERHRGWRAGSLVLEGHTDQIISVTFSPDGSLIISGSYDKTVRVWDAVSGENKHTLSGHTREITSVAFSPDGSQIISGSYDNTVRVWDAVSGAHKHTLSGHTESITSVAFSPDGLQIISGSGDNTVRVWDVVSGAHKHTLSGHTELITSVAFSSDGAQVISGSRDYTVRVWDAVSAEDMYILSGHTGIISSFAFSPDGSLIISGSYDKTVRVWDAVSGENKHTLSGHTEPITSVAFSPDGLQIISGSVDNTARVWDVVFGTHKHTLSGHTRPITSVAFSPDGLQIISGSYDSTVRLWDAVSGEEKHTLSGHTSRITSVSFSPNSAQIISGSWDNTVRVWDAISGENKHTLSGHTREITSVAFSPDGAQVISVSSDTTVRVWDAASGENKHTLRGHTESIASFAFSSDGAQLISGSHDNTVRVWDAVSGEHKHTLSGHTREVTLVAFSPDSTQIISGSYDTTVRVWDIVSGENKHTLSGHTRPITSVAFSPDGSQVISGSYDTIVRVWDIVSGENKHTLSGHTRPITSVAFSPDGSQIISGSWDNTVRVWDAVSGENKHTLSGHTWPITSVAFSPDSSQIITESGDHAVRVWDADTETPHHGSDSAHVEYIATQSGSVRNIQSQNALVRQSVHWEHFTLDTIGGWIYAPRIHGGKRRVCWLPHERRSGGRIASSGERVCVGAATGVVTILDFSNLNDEHSVVDG